MKCSYFAFVNLSEIQYTLTVSKYLKTYSKIFRNNYYANK